MTTPMTTHDTTRHRVASLAELPENEMRTVEAGDTKVLLIRRSGTVHALAALCPHKKVPLDKGIIDGDWIVCGIHRAAFEITSGEVVEPPACESLARYDVTIEGDDVHVDVPAGADPHPIPPMVSRTATTPDTRHAVIVGAGAAGWTAAETLRREGFTGRITVVTDEEDLPYDRTDLSKAYLKADDPEDPWRRDAAFCEEHDITVVRGTAEALNTDDKRLVLGGGRPIAYDMILLATGCDARMLDVPGADLPGIHTIRSLADAKALRSDAASLPDGAKVAVVGGGFVGMEAAASLGGRGFSVTAILMDEVPFKAVIGEGMGRRLREEHEENGVRFAIGKSTGFRGNGRVSHVELEGGEPVEASLVVVGIGAVPRTRWLDLPLNDDGGIDVNADCSVPGVESVWAAGDIARVPTPWGAARIEHWRHAQQLGALAARSMLGRDAAYGEAPFFWTMQWIGGSYSYTGHAEDWDATQDEGDPESPNFVRSYLKDGKVMATFGHGMLARQAEIERAMAKEGPLPA